MNVNKVKLLISDGHFFHVRFVKKDGTIRDMTCRTGVSSYVVGGGKPAPDHIIRVWERCGRTGKDAYRCFDVESLLELKAHGKIYTRDDLIY